MQTLKAVRAFQNNGPDYWIIYEGKQTFGADPVARCDSEERAALIVQAVNTHDRAKAVLQLLLDEYGKGGMLDGQLIIVQAKALLADMEG